MSNALAIASVTAVMSSMINQAMVANDVSAAVGGTIDITNLAPGSISEEELESVRLNLFLYQVAPNVGWSNVALPSRDADGRRLTNPPLALDLFYLLSAYGSQDLEAEIMLGFAIQAFHETPVLTRQMIRDALSVPGGPNTPPPLVALANSDLADQIEQVKITPHPMNTEDSSKLWTAFNAAYRPSFAYHVSVVLIESQRPARSPLPVLSRGERDLITGRDEGVVVQPDMLPPYPTVEEIAPPNKQPAARMGEMLTFRGHHLDADQVLGRFVHMRSSSVFELAAEPGAGPREFRVRLPQDPPPGPVPVNSPENPENWRAGVYVASGVIQRAGEEDRLTNGLPFALAPRIVGPIQSNVGAGNEVTLTVTCSPVVWRGQRVTLVVGDLEIAAEEIAAEKTNTLVFISDTTHVPPGTPMWVRLRVDGVESILIDRSGVAPVFDPTQQVTV
jgi:hypothetical protein